MMNKELVYDKLKQMLGLNIKNKRIPARKCTIAEISSDDAERFLNAYHLQGFSLASIYVGAFYNGFLIGVMSFKKSSFNMSEEWELKRFATNIKYICQGLGSKILNYFVKKYNPMTIVSFADRRWSISPNNTIYNKIGFKFNGITRPSYSYYKLNGAVGEDRMKRHHKLEFRRQVLLKKYPDKLKAEMSETEMAHTLGFERIWDCGMFKFVWYNENN